MALWTLKCAGCGRRLTKAHDDGRRRRSTSRYCDGSSKCRMRALRLRRRIAAAITQTGENA